MLKIQTFWGMQLHLLYSFQELSNCLKRVKFKQNLNLFQKFKTPQKFETSQMKVHLKSWEFLFWSPFDVCPLSFP